EEAARATGFDAVVVGGGLYANRWHRDARRFVERREKDLRHVPVWFFSSGPLDYSPTRAVIPPITQVQILMERVGAKGHMTFGGRLPPDATGFPASAMAKEKSGDWRSPDQIRAWGVEIARALPTAKPGVAIEHPGRSRARLVLHGVVGWALCALVMGGLLSVTSTSVALAVHAVAAPSIFLLVARHYFRARGAREPLTTAVAFVAIVALLDLFVARFVRHGYAMFASIAGTWLPFALIFVVTWVTGLVIASMPWPKAPKAKATPRTA
ncbi:MAG: flavodoxin domain-containing protein, partial [Polyangiales bacterium]